MIMHTPPPPPQPMPITIYVHGTQMHALFDDVDLRTFLPPVSQTSAGLKSVKELPQTHLIRSMLEHLAQSDQKQFPFDGIYTFGWSGSIRVKERENAGYELFQLISSLSKEYASLHGTSPEITLIAHSHGSNVALHMAQYADDAPFSLTRTILLACPVQQRTATYAKNRIFERIYSIHSHDDHIQTMDQGSLQTLQMLLEQWKTDRKIDVNEWRSAMQKNKWKLGSDRHFATQLNLIQTHIIWDSEPEHDWDKMEKGLTFELAKYRIRYFFAKRQRGVLHTEFTTPSFFKQLPKLLSKLDQEWAKHGIPSACITHSIAGH